MSQVNTETVEIDVHLMTSDLRRALFMWQFHRPLAWLFLSIGSVVLLASLTEYLQQHFIPPAPLIIGLFWFAFPFVMPIVQARKAKQIPGGFVAHYMIDHRTLRRTTNGTAVEMAWEVLYGIRETADAFLVLTNKSCFFVIPKRSFATQADLSLTTQIFSEHLRTR